VEEHLGVGRSIGVASESLDVECGQKKRTSVVFLMRFMLQCSAFCTRLKSYM
jgi:hypothetical protein